MPFDCRIRPRAADDLGLGLGLPPARGTHLLVRNALIANLWLAGIECPSGRVFYSRDHSFYAKNRPSLALRVSRRTVVSSIDQLVGAGLAEGDVTRPSKDAKRRSTVWATPGLLERVELRHLDELSFELLSEVVLKDFEGSPVGVPSTGFTRRIRKDVRAQNAVLMSLDVSVGHPDWVRDPYGLYRGPNGLVANLMKRRLYRVFNGSFRGGGRFYGGAWQHLPKDVRATLMINGMPTVELDVAQCHPRLAYAMSGAAFPEGDVYLLPGLAVVLGIDDASTRSIVKKAFNILLNAPTRHSAMGALRLQLEAHAIAQPSAMATRIFDRLRAQHPALSSLRHRGIGLNLQRIDSDFAADVMRRMRSREIPVLPIHESFIVPRSAESLLRETMDVAFAAALRRAGSLRV